MILIRLFEILWPITYLAGFLVSVKYFRKHGRVVFFLLLMYFGLGLYSCTLAKSANRFLMSRTATEIKPETLEMLEAYQKDLDVLHVKYPEIAPGTVVKHVSFPFGQILLVVTLFLIGQQNKRKAPNTNLEPISGSQ